MSDASNTFTDFFSNNRFPNFWENYATVPVDMKSFLETQRKNLQAISDAQQASLEGFQTQAKYQTQMISKFVE